MTYRPPRETTYEERRQMRSQAKARVAALLERDHTPEPPERKAAVRRCDVCRTVTEHGCPECRTYTCSPYLRDCLLQHQRERHS